MSAPTVLTFRDQLRLLSPTWLQEGENEKLIYGAVGLWLDVLGDALEKGVKQRFPGVEGQETIAEIGRERRIRRGAQEDADVYAYRIRYWLDFHATRGGAYSMLVQLHAFSARPDPTSSSGYRQPYPIEMIFRNGRRFTMPAQEFHPYADPGRLPEIIQDDLEGYDPDDTPERWARYWIYLRTDELGPSLSPKDLANLRLVPRDFQPAHAEGFIVLFPSGSETIDTRGGGPDGEVGGPIDRPGTINTGVPFQVIEVG